MCESAWGSMRKFVEAPARGEDSLKLTFSQIGEVAGIPLDHSFLGFKKELLAYGYEVGKISLKEETVIFKKI